jgi:hypothetical protein
VSEGGLAKFNSGFFTQENPSLTQITHVKTSMVAGLYGATGGGAPRERRAPGDPSGVTAVATAAAAAAAALAAPPPPPPPALEHAPAVVPGAGVAALWERAPFLK